MPYAAQIDLESRFGADELAQLTDRVNGSVIDAAVVGRALADADAEIDGYLAGRYRLPLASTPAVLVRIASDIARYRLYDSVPESIRKRYEDAVRDLKAIATGAIVIDENAPLTPTPGQHEASVTQPSRPRVFNGGLQ